MEHKIRWGIIGLGGIAHHFIKDLLMVDDAKLIAVASRSEDKALAFKEQYGATHAYGSYQELFDCADVDVVYIATPHTAHADLAIQAMNAGKHVLCEKPMGVNALEVDKMIASARTNNVFLMEALWSRFNPAIRKVVAHIENGEIGNIQYLHADFAFYALDRDPNGRLLNPDLAGGSLLDIGIYPIFLTYLLLGKPENIEAKSKFFNTGVEIGTVMVFEYAQAQALLYSGLTSKSEMRAQISGTKGTLLIEPRWHEAQGYTLVKGDHTEDVFLPTKGRGYYYEIMEVHQCLRNEALQSPLWSHQNSKDLIGLLDSVRQVAGIVFPFEQ